MKLWNIGAGSTFINILIFFVTFPSVECFTHTQNGKVLPFFANRDSLHNKRFSTRIHALYSEETLSERLQVVQQNWENIKAMGLKKFAIQELNIIQKEVEKSFIYAEKAAEEAIKEEVKENTIARNIVDRIDATKALWEASSSSAIADSYAIKDLSDAANNVRDSIQEAEKLVQSVAEKTATNEKLVDNVVSSLGSAVKDLTDAADNVKESIKEAASIADAVSNAASKDVVELDILESTSEELIQSIGNVEAIAQQTSQPNTISSKAADSLEKAADIVVQNLKEAENVATNMAKVAQVDSDAVISMDDKAEDVINSLQAVKSAIEGLSGDPSSLEKLKVAASDAVETIKVDEAAVEVIANTVQKDALNSDAISALKSADNDIDNLVAAMKDAANDASTLSNLDSQTKSATDSLNDMKAASSECADCAVNAVKAVISSSEESNLINADQKELIDFTKVEDANKDAILNVDPEKSLQSVGTGSGESVKAVDDIISNSDVAVGAQKSVENAGGNVIKSVESITNSDNKMMESITSSGGTETKVLEDIASKDNGILGSLKAQALGEESTKAVESLKSSEIGENTLKSAEYGGKELIKSVEEIISSSNGVIESLKLENRGDGEISTVVEDIISNSNGLIESLQSSGDGESMMKFAEKIISDASHLFELTSQIENAAELIKMVETLASKCADGATHVVEAVITTSFSLL